MFVPRLSKDGMLNSQYWYSNTNPFFASGYGLPNCTCYAWGRFWEISNVVPHLPTGNGGEWWGNVSGYEVGQEPQLGAAMCFYDPNGAGHVAVVEQILDNGDLITSNSNYYRPAEYDNPNYFYLATQRKANNYLSDDELNLGFSFQGFIYNPEEPVPPQPAPTSSKMPLWFYNKLI